MFYKFENVERRAPLQSKISATLNQGGVLKNDSKVPTSPRLSLVFYYLGKSLSLFISLIVSGRVHVLYESF